MTKPTKAGGQQPAPAFTSAEQPPERRIEIDPVAAYFQKRMKTAENDALILAAENRDLAAFVKRQQEELAEHRARIVELEKESSK